MTRKTVRDTIDNELETFLSSLASPVPFYDTDNLKEFPTDPIWCSTVYYSDLPENICFGHERTIETGSIVVAVFTKGGTGYSDGYTLADAIQDHFRQYLGPIVEIVNVISASESPVGDASGRYFVLDVELLYRHEY